MERHETTAERLERIESVKPPAELADGEPYKREKPAKPVKSIYCKHGLILHKGCKETADKPS